MTPTNQAPASGCFVIFGRRSVREIAPQRQLWIWKPMNLANGQTFTLHFSPELKNRWPTPLAREWKRKYPRIFDDDDLRLTINQPLGHFYEWFVAIHLYESYGAVSLVEKYCYRKHQRKAEFLDRFLSAEHCAFLRNFRKMYRVQPPDLFVYMPSSKRFWFAEVKGPGDRLSVLQRHSHNSLARRLGVDVQMFYVRRA